MPSVADVPARVRIAPSAGPMQGVQPMANDMPMSVAPSAVLVFPLYSARVER